MPLSKPVGLTRGGCSIACLNFYSQVDQHRKIISNKSAPCLL